MPFSPEVLDDLLKDCKTPEQMFGADGLLQQLTKALIERSLQAELTHHLGYEKHAAEGDHSGNSRNGAGAEDDPGQARSSPDRGAARPQRRVRAAAHQERPDALRRATTERVLSLYARGLSAREIQAHLHEVYGTEVSPDLISTVTDAVLDEVRAWQARPLDEVYPILYLDALQVKDQGRVSNKAIYLAIGVNMRGLKEVLGMWASENEGAKFWLSIVTELKSRGVRDIFIACVDGLKGFPEAIETVFPRTQVQLCLVHLVRYSLAFVSFKDRKVVAADLKAIYRAATEAEAAAQLEAFAAKWDERYQLISKSWRANWARLTPMFAYPEDIRRAIYTTNVIESLNMTLRKVTRDAGLVPERRGGLQAAVPGVAKHPEKVDDADRELEPGDQRVGYSL